MRRVACWYIRHCGLSTEDQGKLVSNSIFGAQHAADVQSVFALESINVMDLAALCRKQFWFPLRRWP